MFIPIMLHGALLREPAEPQLGPIAQPSNTKPEGHCTYPVPQIAPECLYFRPPMHYIEV